VTGAATAGGARRRRHPARWIAGAVMLVLVAVAVVAATRPSVQASQDESPLLGRPAPALSGTTLTGGHLSLAQFRGRTVVVNFFASWCPPCQQEEPDLVQFAYQQRHTPGGAVLVGVVYDDPDSDARQFMVSQGATWPALEDTDGDRASAYGVTAPPSTFVIDPAGRVVADLIGPVTTRQLDSLVSSLRSDDE
jgi:cytochrome c biogenesis protein CcmG/thiol:disulfide interchange protein DsbE